MSILLLCLTGCFDDKGNYDYVTMPEVEVAGIADQYTFHVASTQTITPEIAYKNREIARPSYAWRIEGKLIGEQKDLEFVVRDLPIRAGLYGEFVITDEDTGIEYITLFKVTVKSEFQSGWVMLADGGDRSGLHYLRDDDTFYEDIFRISNNADLSRGAYALTEHFLYFSSELGQLFVACQAEPDYSVELDGATFQQIVRTRDEFVGEMPSGFKPMNMSCVLNYDYLVSDGKLYVRNILGSWDALYQDGLFPNFPIPGNYRLGRRMIRGNLLFSSDIIGFDENSGSYLLIRNGELHRFDYVNDPNKAFIPYDMGKRLLDGGPVSTETPLDEFIAFLREEGGSRAYVQRFIFTGWGAKSYRSVSEVEFPQPALLGEESRFAICQRRPYAYISSGTKLYIYNYQDNTVRELRDFGRPVRNIAICRANYERLGIALQNAADASQSDFMELDVSVIGEGKTVMSREGISGKVVDIIYKLGDQWVTY